MEPSTKWSPTHDIGPTPQSAWLEPDPSQPVVATLDPNLPVQVTETRGGWAAITCSNGWTAWVDHSLLVARAAPRAEPRAPQPAGPPPSDAGPRSQPLAAEPNRRPNQRSTPAEPSALASGSRAFDRTSAGLCGALVACFLLPWLSGAGESANGFDLASSLREQLSFLPGRTKYLGYAMQGLYVAAALAGLSILLRLVGNRLARIPQLAAAGLTLIAVLLLVSDDQVEIGQLSFGFWATGTLAVALILAERMDRWTGGSA